MAEVASSSSHESSKKSVAKALPKNALVFPDHLTGRRVIVVPDGILPSPKQLRAQIKRPLELIKHHKWFFALQSPGMKLHLEEPPPPLDYMLTELPPCVPVRVMCGCVATACRRLATAPSGVRMAHMSWSWAEMVMERVTRGLKLAIFWKKADVVAYLRSVGAPQ
jgi:hypothetical protein